jgi:hypothetical protein
MAGAPILLVIHYADDDTWAFLDGEPWEPDQGLMASMGSIVDIHPYVLELADLPPGWSASQMDGGPTWLREALPEDDV